LLIAQISLRQKSKKIEENIFKLDLVTDTDFGIHIRIFTTDTDGYPQALWYYLYPYPYPWPGPL